MHFDSDLIPERFCCDTKEYSLTTVSRMSDYQDEADTSALWIKDGLPLPLSIVSFIKRWLFPTLTAIFIISLIIALGVSSTKSSSRLTSMEKSVSNLTSIINSMNSSLQQAHERAKEVEKMRFAVENNKDELNSVSEALKQLSVVNYLSRTVASLKCSLERIANNRSGSESCCPAGWDEFDFYCYYFSGESLPWNQSRAWCEKEGAHLLILHSDKAWDFVVRHSIPRWFWIGLSAWRTGRWEWVNETPYTIERRRWRVGQPDRWTGHGLGGTEDCAHLHSDGRLNDQHCSAPMHFICQKRSVRQ